MALHINRVVNKDCLRAIMQCGPYFSPLSAGDPTAVFKEKDSVWFAEHRAFLLEQFAKKSVPSRGLTQLTPEAPAAVEVFLPSKEDWKNLRVLVGRKGEAWSKDPFTKRSSLKLPYKPENLGSDLLVAPKGVVARMQ